MSRELVEAYQDVCRFCELNDHRCPSYQWLSKEALVTLAQYPSGLTKSVMITVLEQRWRDSVRRGEHSGKLWGVLTNQQLESSDVLEGNLALVQGDGFRGRLSSSAGSDGLVQDDDEGKNSRIDMIMHRQHADFHSFCTSQGYPLLSSGAGAGASGRPVLLTGGRILKGKPPLLLPTPYMCYKLDAEKDKGFFQSVLAPKHREFFAHVNAGKGVGEPLSPENKVFDDNQALCAKVVAMSNSFAHPDSPTTVTRIVRMEISADAWVPQQQQQQQVGGPKPKTKKLYMVLFNEAVCLSSLWAEGSFLVIYRPYVSSNHDEVLFGSRVHNGAMPMMGVQASKHTLDHMLVRQAAPMLEGALSDAETVPVYLQFGQVTSICVLSRSAAGGAAPTAVAAVGSVDSTAPMNKAALLAIVAAARQAQQQAQPLAPADPLSLRSLKSVLARLVHLDMGGLGARGSATGYLWLLPLLEDNNGVPNAQSQAPPVLLCVRCSPATLRSLQQSQRVLPGHVLFLEELTPLPLPAQGQALSLPAGFPVWMRQAMVLPVAMASSTEMGTAKQDTRLVHYRQASSSSPSSKEKARARASSSSSSSCAQNGGGDTHSDSGSSGGMASAIWAVNFSRLAAVLSSTGIFAPSKQLASTSAPLANDGNDCWLSVVVTIKSARRLGSPGEASSSSSGAAAVVDLTGGAAGQAKKRRRNDSEESGAGESQAKEGLEDTWVLLIRDAAGGEAHALVSPHSTTLTPLLDPRGDLARSQPKWKEEEFSFLLSRVDDVAAGDAAIATMLRDVQTHSQQRGGGGMALYRVDVCNKAGL